MCNEAFILHARPFSSGCDCRTVRVVALDQILLTVRYLPDWLGTKAHSLHLPEFLILTAYTAIWYAGSQGAIVDVTRQLRPKWGDCHATRCLSPHIGEKALFVQQEFSTPRRLTRCLTSRCAKSWDRWHSRATSCWPLTWHLWWYPGRGRGHGPRYHFGFCLNNFLFSISCGLLPWRDSSWTSNRPKLIVEDSLFFTIVSTNLECKLGLENRRGCHQLMCFAPLQTWHCTKFWAWKSMKWSL